MIIEEGCILKSHLFKTTLFYYVVTIKEENMKKINLFKKGCCIFLLFVLVFTGAVMPASANDYEESNGFYVTANQVPNEVINYAVDNAYNFLVSRSDIDNIDLNNVTMGTPFTIAAESINVDEVYYFPIFLGEKVIYTFRVYEDNAAYTGILSPYLAEELNKYMNTTTKSNPLSIYMDSGKVMALQGGVINVLEEAHYGYEPIGNKVLFFADSFDVVNINDKIDLQISSDVSPMAAASKNLSLDMLETQGSQSWCAAFAMSSILRYKGAGNVVTAKAIMKDTFPNSKDLENESISRSQLVSYAKGKGYKKTKESSSTLSNSTVVSEIATNSTPIYAGCDGTGTYKKARHALVISGYDNNKSTYTVWNPWYSYTETIDQSSKKYKVDSSSSFVWDVTIYQVRK